MMKYALLLFGSLIFSSFMVGDHASGQKKFRIVIREESMLWMNTYVVTPDSIAITKDNRVEGTSTSAAKILNDKERAEIEKLLDQMVWSALKESYIDDTGPQDMYNYQFSFEWKQNAKQVRIYQVKQEEIFALVQGLNTMLSDLPARFRISYTEEYFRNKR